MSSTQVDKAKLLDYLYASRNKYMEEAKNVEKGCASAAFAHKIRSTTFDLMIHVVKVGLLDVEYGEAI